MVILGAARQGLALAEYLSDQGARITVTDQKDMEVLQDVVNDFQGKGINWALGGHPVDLLEDADVLSVSGGVPLTIPFIQEAQQMSVMLTNDSQIFLEETPCKVIGITGSAGKTTTTTLVGRMAAEAFGQDRSWMGGNIGNPLIRDLCKIEEDHIAVMELSSFQLELMTVSPDIACIVNITPNHLDRHGTMDAYTAAKARILDNQKSIDIAVLNRDDPISWGLRDQIKGKLVSFGKDKPEDNLPGTYIDDEWISFWNGQEDLRLMPLSSIQLRGEHNRLNVLAACAIGIAADFPANAMRRGVEGLSGVPHRLESIRSWKGAEWVNDSKATAPELSIAAMRSFEEPLVLLAGGRDKDLPWEKFSQMVLERVRYLILFGEAADLIEKEILRNLSEGSKMIPLTKVAGLMDAVQEAAQICREGDVVLLSPGGTSFDEFADFEERGEMFRVWVNELT